MRASRRANAGDNIVDVTARLAQQPDPTAMTFQALGRELGPGPTAVDRRFRDRNELVEACLDRLIGRVTGSVSGGLSQREWLGSNTPTTG